MAATFVFAVGVAESLPGREPGVLFDRVTVEAELPPLVFVFERVSLDDARLAVFFPVAVAGRALDRVGEVDRCFVEGRAEGRLLVLLVLFVLFAALRVDFVVGLGFLADFDLAAFAAEVARLAAFSATPRADGLGFAAVFLALAVVFLALVAVFFALVVVFLALDAGLALEAVFDFPAVFALAGDFTLEAGLALEAGFALVADAAFTGREARPPRDVPTADPRAAERGAGFRALFGALVRLGVRVSFGVCLRWRALNPSSGTLPGRCLRMDSGATM